MGREVGWCGDTRLFAEPNAFMADPSGKLDCCAGGRAPAIPLSSPQMLIELFMDVLFHAVQILGNKKGTKACKNSVNARYNPHLGFGFEFYNIFMGFGFYLITPAEPCRLILLA
jgi:hypothetical protein